MNLRVLIVAPIFPPYTGGGAEVYKLLLAEYQNFRELERVFLLTEYHPKCPLVKRDGKCWYLRLLPPRDGPGKKGRIYHVASFLATYFLLCILVPLIVVSCGVQCVHYTRYIPPFPSPFDFVLGLLRRFGVRVVVDKRARIRNSSHIRRLRHYDRMLWNSRVVAESAIAAGLDPNRGVIIQTPFVPPAPLPNTECLRILRELKLLKVRPYICFVGNITRRKGIFELLDAFEYLHKSDLKMRKHSLVIVGRNSEGKQFLKKVAGCCQVYYVGPLEREKALVVIQGSELLVLPSRAEGVPRVCLEAIALGVPVITPPGIPEFDEIPNNVSFADVNPSTIAETIKNILPKPVRIGYPFERHEPRKIARQTVALYYSSSEKEAKQEGLLCL